MNVVSRFGSFGKEVSLRANDIDHSLKEECHLESESSLSGRTCRISIEKMLGRFLMCLRSRD
jgi:hypothetical protein